MTITFKFWLWQVVNLLPIGGKGRIVSLRLFSNTVEYEVRYFNNGESKCAWFFEDELV